MKRSYWLRWWKTRTVVRYAVLTSEEVAVAFERSGMVEAIPDALMRPSPTAALFFGLDEALMDDK